MHSSADRSRAPATTLSEIVKYGAVASVLAVGMHVYMRVVVGMRTYILCMHLCKLLEHTYAPIRVAVLVCKKVAMESGAFCVAGKAYALLVALI